MTRLEWGTAGERLYEVGVDHGVLYVNGAGVPWNGLVSVVKESNGGEAKPFYIDGVKFSNRATAEEYQATLTAYTYPEEFAQCDGSAKIGQGLFATNQRRKTFDLCFRTKIGDDVVGDSRGYKLHLVYNALAAPSERNHATVADSIAALNFAWLLTTKPPAISKLRRTSYFIIDSRETSETLLTEIEEILYGNSANEPRMPTVDELVSRFEADSSGNYDAGFVGQSYYDLLDGGHIPAVQTSTVDGGEL